MQLGSERHLESAHVAESRGAVSSKYRGGPCRTARRGTKPVHRIRQLLSSCGIRGEVGRECHVANGNGFSFFARLFMCLHEVLSDDGALQKLPRGLQIVFRTGKVASSEFDPPKRVP